MIATLVEVEVKRVTEVGAGTIKGAHLADHGEDDGEGLGGRVEGDVEDLGGVDNAMDGLEGVGAALVETLDRVGSLFRVFEVVAAHGYV